MRLSFVHLLVALLIAIFAIGAPRPAQAECAKCVDCSTQMPAKSEAPCPDKAIVCQVTTSCASQLQKMPATAAAADDISGCKAVFRAIDDIAANLTSLKPETSPPRA